MNMTQQMFYRQVVQHFPWCTRRRCHFTTTSGVVLAVHEGYHSVRDAYGTVHIRVWYGLDTPEHRALEHGRLPKFVKSNSATPHDLYSHHAVLKYGCLFRHRNLGY